MSAVEKAKKIIEDSRDTALPFLGGVLGELLIEKVLTSSFQMINPSTARMTSLFLSGGATGKYLYDENDKKAVYALGGVFCGTLASYLYDKYSTDQIIDSEGDEYLIVDAVSDAWDQLTEEEQALQINEVLGSNQLTKDFYIYEFRDHRTGQLPPAEFMSNVKNLASNLQILRDSVGRQINILSAYRSHESNRLTGGKPASLHLTASAADIRIPGLTPVQVFLKIQQLINEGKMKQGGVGLYQNPRNLFVHYDIRGTKTRWDDSDSGRATRNIWS